MSIDVVLGLQRGDEGKGRIVDLMSHKYAIVARFNGGPNAGHTISLNGQALALHQVPSGVREPDILNIIGNGTLLDLNRLADEVKAIRVAGIDVSPKNFAISDAAHLILPHHIALDELREHGNNAQGTTKRGIAFAAGDKYQRSGIRAEAVSDLKSLKEHATSRLLDANKQLRANGLQPYGIEAEIKKLLGNAKLFKPYITDTVTLLHEHLSKGADVLAEGAQATSLDIEQAPYPFGTSAHTTVGGALTGLSIGPQHVRTIMGVIKATKSHVGDGPFPTEIKDEKLAKRVRGELGQIDSEYGASTGRSRRIGYLDLPELRRAIRVNGVNKLVLNKLDCLPRYGRTTKIAVAYELDGQQLDMAPGSAAKLTRCKPVYETVELWGQDISGVRQYKDLPREAQACVEFIEAQLGLPIDILGVGPHKDQIIRR